MSTFDRVAAAAFVREKVLLGMEPKVYAKSLFTKANAIFAAILVVGLPTMAYRFWKGMGAVTQPLADEPVGHLGRVRHRVRRRARRRRLHAWPRAVYIFGQRQFRPGRCGPRS